MNKTMNKLVIIGLSVFFLSSCGNYGENPKIESTVTNTPNIILISTAESIRTDETEESSSLNGLVPEDLRNYIGKKYPPLPENLTQKYGLVIWDSDDFGLARILDDKRDMLWLIKFVDRDAKGLPIWEVKDILVLPDLDIESVLVDDQCILNGKVNSEIIAIGKTDSEVYSTRHLPNEKILFAWRANTGLGIFQIISTKGVECFTG